MALEAYFTHLLVLIGVYMILAMSLNLSMGFTGLLNIGHIAFFGIGAYTSALLVVRLGVSFWPAMLIGAIVATVFGILLAIPTIKLKGDYLALATLGFTIIVETVLRNWSSLTNGPVGLPGIPRPEIFGRAFDSTPEYLMLVLLFVVITYAVIKYITASPFGRVLKAIREDELVANSLGKNTTKYKTVALAISAFFAGIAGSIYAHYISFIDPSSFAVMESIFIIAMIIVGGLGSVEGSMVGVLIILLLPEPLRFLPLPAYAIGALRQFLFAFLLVMILVLRPNGLLGKYRFSRGDKDA